MVKTKAIYIEDDLHEILREQSFKQKIPMVDIIDKILRKELIKKEDTKNV